MTANMAHIMARVLGLRARGDHYVDVTSEVRTATIQRVRRLLPLLAVPVLAFAGCSEINDAIDGSINDVAEQALEDGIRRQLDDAGIQLESGPDCSTDLSRDGASLTGTADCGGTTVEGHDVAAEFDGTLSTSGCTGTITVVVDDRTVVDGQEVPDCSVNL
ncbi:MAG TPA: hypothetical protein VFZ85_14450 [Jiangellaceae bacterium]